MKTFNRLNGGDWTPALLACGMMVLSGCSTELQRKAQHADGAIDFARALAGYEHIEVAPVRTEGGGVVRVVSAHAVQDGEQMRVYGRLERLGFGFPGPGAHLDVRLVAANGKIIAQAPARYSRTILDRRQRGAIPPRASYSARLPLPPPGAHVEIAHHDEPLKACAVAKESGGTRS